jgi:hypothetical protein
VALAVRVARGALVGVAVRVSAGVGGVRSGRGAFDRLPFAGALGCEPGMNDSPPPVAFAASFIALAASSAAFATGFGAFGSRWLGPTGPGPGPVLPFGAAVAPALSAASSASAALPSGT